MKILSFVILFAMLLHPQTGHANSRHAVLRGGLVGAATGALLSELSSDISGSTAIPVLAGVGALTGYTIHRHRNRDYYSYYPHGIYLHGIPAYHHAVGYRHRWHRQSRPTPVYVVPVTQTRQNPQSQSRQTATANSLNRHPGVARIPVSFTTPSGFPLTITITKIGNQYVGPRGEKYTNMPTVEQLQEIYRP